MTRNARPVRPIENDDVTSMFPEGAKLIVSTRGGGVSLCDVNGDVVGVHRNKRTVSKGPLLRVMGGRVQAVGEVSDACIEYNLTKKSQVIIDNEVHNVRD